MKIEMSDLIKWKDGIFAGYQPGTDKEIIQFLADLCLENEKKLDKILVLLEDERSLDTLDRIALVVG